jgi:indole-3-glycerol phosphate synthase
MPITLGQIVAATRAKLEQRKAAASIPQLEAAAAEHRPRGFRRALLEAGEKRPAVIAELKKASPSRGLIRQDFDVRELAMQLRDCGATALSVLTEENYFQGSLEYLGIASSASGLPCVRKDFIVDEFQVLEARACHADAILLIVAALTDPELKTLSEAAGKIGLDALCEVHDAGELKRALDIGFDTIGVNNRDLRTFNVSLETAFSLASQIPKSALRVAESGIRAAEQMWQLREAGYQAFLIGEWLMSKNSPGDELKKLLCEASPTAEAQGARRSS